MTEREIEDKSPSEALMDVMASFSNDEPEGWVMVWVGKDAIHVWRNHVSLSHAVGLLRMGEHIIMDTYRQDKD